VLEARFSFRPFHDFIYSYDTLARCTFIKSVL
jgi:hypothetical protein